MTSKIEGKLGVLREALPKGLSAKLLLLTILFVMLAEVLIFVPSVANYRVNWLTERATTAQVASLAAEAAPGGEVPKSLNQELLKSARVVAVAFRRNNKHMLILSDDMPHHISAHYDLRTAPFWRLIVDAVTVFFHSGERFIRVITKPSYGTGEKIEIFVYEKPLRDAMIQFGFNILGLSIVISVFTAALVYLTLNMLFVRPIARLTEHMIRFRENPESPDRIIVPSDRRDEIGTAERELATMQAELLTALKQKSHLAALGLAVSKISHDLRNMLANAQLISDRFETIDNPVVQRFAPKLIKSLDRAIRLCTETLKYGSVQEAHPVRTHFRLHELVREVGEGIGLNESDAVTWKTNIEQSLIADADRDQLYRVLANLCRNAFEVLSASKNNAIKDKVICVSAQKDDDNLVITIADTGPGLPQKARDNLFEPFSGSVREGGTGLGLVISAELVRAHGGEICLLDNEPGATFQIKIPYTSKVS